MANNNLDKLLAPNTVPYQGMVFSPLAFKPIEENVNLLQNSLKQIEERSEKAATHRAALKKALGEARLKVNQDEESLKFFDQLADNIEAPIRSASERGDLAGAIEATQDAAGELTSNPAYLGLIQNTARYQDAVKSQKDRLNRGDITNEAFERWNDENVFNANFVEDDNGKIIGSKEWNQSYSPVSQGDLYGVFKKIADGLSVRKETHAPGEVVVDEQGNLVSHTSRSGQLEALDRSKFIRDSNDAIKGNTVYRNLAFSDFQDQIHYYEKHKNDEDSAVKAKCDMIYNTYYTSGFPDFDKYVDNLCDKYANDFSYLWDLRSSDTTVPRTSGSGSQTTTTTTGGSTTAGAGNQAGTGTGTNSASTGGAPSGS